MSNPIKEQARKLLADLRDAGKDCRPVLAVANTVDRFITELRQRIAAQVEELERLRTTLDTRGKQCNAAEKRVAELETQVHSLTQRLTNLENKPKLLESSRKLDAAQRVERRRNRVRFDPECRFEDAPTKVARANGLFIGMVGIGSVPRCVREEDYVHGVKCYVSNFGLRTFMEDFLSVLLQSAYCFTGEMGTSARPMQVFIPEAAALPQPRVVFAPRYVKFRLLLRLRTMAEGVALNPVLVGMDPFPPLNSEDTWLDTACKYVRLHGIDQFLVDVIYLLRCVFGENGPRRQQIPFGYSNAQLKAAGLEVLPGPDDGEVLPTDASEADVAAGVDLSEMLEDLLADFDDELHGDDCDCDDDCDPDCGCECHDDDLDDEE